MRLAGLMLFVLATSVTTAAAQSQQDAESIYKTRCASCHEAGVARAPNREGLRRLTPQAIGAALTAGSMREQGQNLTLDQIQQLSRALGAAPATATPTATSTCSSNEPASLAKPLEQPN